MSSVIYLSVKRKTAKIYLVSVPPREDELSFVTWRREGRKRMGGYNYWTVAPTGRHGDDCETGHRLAEEYLAFIGKCPTNGNHTLLTCIVRDMIDQASKGAPWSGVHVGFLAGVNGHAMAMAATLVGKGI